MSKVRNFPKNYDFENSRLESSEKDLQFEDFDYTRYQVRIIKEAFPWVVSSAIAILLFLAVILALVYGLKLNEPVQLSTIALPTTTYYTYKGIGESCTSSIECIPSAFCEVSTCSCSPQFYHDAKAGACLFRKTYGQSCTSSVECEYFAYLSCLNDVCSCDSTYFYWNTRTQKCEDLRGLGQSCTDSSECLSRTMKCDYFNGGTSKQCACASSQYYSFQTNACEMRKGHGVQCFNEKAHFECMENAWCTQFPSDLTFRCSCHPHFYWNLFGNSCTEKKSIESSCINSFECMDYLGQTCDLITKKCACPSSSYWNVSSCIPKQSLGGVCNITSNCLYAGMVCDYRPEKQDRACLCLNGTYFSLRTKSCVSYLHIGDICEFNNDCPMNSTCKYEPLSSNKICKCSEDLYYHILGTNQCASLKKFTQSCLNTYECNTWLGLSCINFRCQCSVNEFYNGYECERKKGVDASSYQKYCVNAYECKNNSLLLACYEGSCKCDHGKVFVAASNLCV